MPVTQSVGEEDILTRLKEIPGVDVMDGDYVEDSYVPKLDANKLFKPYILVSFSPGNYGFDPGIADPSWDTQRAQFDVFVVSPSARLTRDLRDQVREKLLVSFRPTDASYIKSGGGYKFVDADLGYHRYVQVPQFTYTFNLAP